MSEVFCSWVRAASILFVFGFLHSEYRMGTCGDLVLVLFDIYLV
jgi:hypothetical protein